jgi:hypothetical protein
LNEAFNVCPDLLEDAQRLAAALVLKDLVREFQRMAQSVLIDPGSQTLRDDVDEVVLEILCHAGDECHADSGQQQPGDSFHEIARTVRVEPCGVLVDDVPEDERIQEREHLVDRGQGQGQQHQLPQRPQVTKQHVHRLCVHASAWSYDFWEGPVSTMLPPLRQIVVPARFWREPRSCGSRLEHSGATGGFSRSAHTGHASFCLQGHYFTRSSMYDRRTSDVI